MRGIAVLLVVLYHAGVPWLGGGYAGVDVFYVLSGFLITGLLLRELEQTGRISLPSFYARRARRLLPAALLVLLVTVVASAFVIAPLDVPDVSRDVTSAALYVSNIRFAILATDYLHADAAPSPVLHYWSLGVEEQFYLFWPAIVLVVAGAAATARRRIGLAVGVISIATLGLGIWLTSVNQPWAFFSLPTRAWELGIGAMLAVVGARIGAVPRPVAVVLGWLGLAMVVAAGLMFTSATPFPGTAALLPTVGAGLVVAFGAPRSIWTVGGLLGTAVTRFFGRISYSLYLWHWPLLILPAEAAGRSLDAYQRAGLVLVAIVLAWATERLVEGPLRHGRIVGTVPRRNLALAGAFSIAVALAATSIGNAALSGMTSTAASNPTANEQALMKVLGAAPQPSAASPAAASSTDPAGGSGASPGESPAFGGASPSPSMPPPTQSEPVPRNLQPPLADARNDYSVAYAQGCHLAFDGTRSPPCVYGDPHGSKTVVLFGDSHALAWFPTVDRIALNEGWRLVNLTKSGCGSSDVTQWIDALNRPYTECSTWRETSMARIAAEHPSLVILANSRALAVVAPGGAILRDHDAVGAWEAGLERTEQRIAAMGDVKVVVLGDVPRSSFDAPVCLSQHRNDILACSSPYTSAVDPVWTDAAETAAAAQHAFFIDPTPWVCPSAPCPPVIANFLVYRDQQHLTTAFATALAPYLGSALPPLG